MNSLILSDQEIANLKKQIKQLNLKSIPPTNEYELLRIKEDKLHLVLYNTGKLVFNERSETLKILNSILQRATGYDYFLGSDETGKGEWYGPLVVVATALKPEEIIKLRLAGVKDSKTIKAAKIKEIAKNILEMDFTRESIILNPNTYNRLYSNFKNEAKSLNDIMAWAHSKVLQDIIKKVEFNQAKIVIDRFDFRKTEYRLRNLDRNRLDIIQKKGGESETPVATASIIAKYLFEREVDKLNDKFKIDLRRTDPAEIKPGLLPDVAKLHFKNVHALLK